MHVLLAEDNPINQEVAAGLLEALDCTATIVENGQDAVEAVRDGKFDLVLMDCQMPVMDGLEATGAIRNLLSDNRNLPIIALTANAVKEAKKACLAAGMDDFLSKPFTLQELQALLQRWQPSNQSTMTIDAAPASKPEPSSLDLSPIDALCSLDPSGERNIVQRAITKFIDYSDDVLTKLDSAVSENDVQEISRMAHSLKSSSANLGATDLARQCAELERLIGETGMPSDIGERLTALLMAQQTAKNDLRQLIA